MLREWIVLGPENGIRAVLHLIAAVTHTPWRIVDRPRLHPSTQICSVVLEMSDALAADLRERVRDAGVTISPPEYAHPAGL